MTDPFSIPTRELIADTAICAFNDGRDRAQPDPATRDQLLATIAARFDLLVEGQRPRPSPSASPQPATTTTPARNF